MLYYPSKPTMCQTIRKSAIVRASLLAHVWSKISAKTLHVSLGTKCKTLFRMYVHIAEVVAVNYR